ncbi:hypothetical protein GTA08_BOTSDO08919 [Neofusicoccum parvum]|uniref:Uncharacterized protein n=1 Tax=Neofusicoccum parvum TaxID=310453 RepID=A0ACB5SJZ6_9PEZI|nr:hypothetical protein GTA08_BOTSDO08919 [Neofusicoccum parvum]GME53518.1 hypothetical protein GTA08_BOTSDO08919 [Neofusicoccum parvum]
MPRPQHSYTPMPIPRPMLLRVLSITAISLPPLLYLVAFALTLKVIYSPAYAASKLYDSFGTPNGLVVHASPFYNCTKAPTTAIDDPSTNTSFKPTCTRLKNFMGTKGMAACETIFATDASENEQICQKIVGSASLYITGAILTAFALALAIVHLAVSWPGASAAKERPGIAYAAPARPPTADEKLQKMHAPSDEVLTPVGLREGLSSNLPYVWALVGTLATLFALLAAAALFLAQLLGWQALVNEQHPTAGDNPGTFDQGRWYALAPAFDLSAAAWVVAGVGAYVAASKCGAISRTGC